MFNKHKKKFWLFDSINNTEESIEKNITLSILAGVLIIVSSVFFVADRVTEKWLKSVFDNAMIDKSNTLITLTKQLDDEIDFDFADEFMPEFSGGKNQEYFQIWVDKKPLVILEKSDSLGINSLPLKETTKPIFFNLTLPDGRSGRILQVYFMPQIPEDEDRTPEALAKQDPVYLSITAETESLNNVIFYIRSTIIITVILVLLLFYLVTKFSVKKGLSVINDISHQFESIDVNHLSSRIRIDNPPREVKDLILECNVLLERLEGSFIREKRFSSDVSHELKTPITEIKSLTEIVLKWPKSKSITENYPQHILDICQKMESLVKDLLLLARFESDHSNITMSSINVIGSIKKSVLNFNKLLSEKDINIKYDINSDSLITANLSQWNILLNNIISNGVYHSSNKSIFYIHSSTNHDGYLTLFFSNKIHNFDTKNIKHVFDPFWCADSSRSGERTGIGLALVKAICKKHNFKITANIEHDYFRVIVSEIRLINASEQHKSP